MKAILQYVQKIIASKKDGTISIMIETGETATLTIKNRSIVAASLEKTSGKEALEAIKLANIQHMEFWMGITQKSDIQKMIGIQTDTNALSPIPEDEMHPEGAPLSGQTDPPSVNPVPPAKTRPAVETSSKSDQPQKAREQSTEEPPPLSDEDISALASALTDYIGPAAGIIIESLVEQASDIDHLIQLLSDELFSDKDRTEFAHKAYFLLGQR
jgi:hypothetical protein